METAELFTIALNLGEPWKVEKVAFLPADKGELELHMHIGFTKGALFECSCEGCTQKVTAYDSSERTWRHLNFFQYKTYIHARLPRIKCPDHGVKTVSVPWARAGCGFTLLFESWCVECAKYIPVSVLARMVGENDTRLWRFIKYYVDKAKEEDSYSEVENIGIDETSKKGHHYITVVVDLNERRVIFVTDGKDSSCVNKFVTDLQAHGGNKKKIKVITCDMSLGFKKGIMENFENATTVIDKFHVIKHINEAVDKTRKAEARTKHELKGTKYLWLKNESTLSERQKSQKERLMNNHLKTGRALMMREALQDIYETAKDRGEAPRRITKLISWIMHSRLPHMKDFAKLLRNHYTDILNYFDLKYTNAILEGMNSIIQNIKRRARGFRNVNYFTTMIYLVCGKLPFEKYLIFS